MLNPTPVVIDIEGFRCGGEPFIVKEISCCADYVDSITLQPPLGYEILSAKEEKAFSWITNNLNGLDWKSGNFKFEFLQNFVESIKLRNPDSKFYAKGIEKCKILEEIFQLEFINLDKLGCPKVNQIAEDNKIAMCEQHCPKITQTKHISHHCARRKSVLFHSWLQNILEEDLTPSDDTVNPYQASKKEIKFRGNDTVRRKPKTVKITIQREFDYGSHHPQSPNGNNANNNRKPKPKSSQTSFITDFDNLQPRQLLALARNPTTQLSNLSEQN